MDATSFTASLWAYNGKVFALSEDGDTYVMAGRARIQGARQELARRNEPGDAGGRQRQRDHPHRDQAVSDRKVDVSVRAFEADLGSEPRSS